MAYTKHWDAFVRIYLTQHSNQSEKVEAQLSPLDELFVVPSYYSSYTGAYAVYTYSTVKPILNLSGFHINLDGPFSADICSRATVFTTGYSNTWPDENICNLSRTNDRYYSTPVCIIGHEHHNVSLPVPVLVSYSPKTLCLALISQRQLFINK